MSPRRLTPQEYTVGWICALPKEMTVAIALLDEEHESLHLQDDDNSYALGRIGNHNVAIACLPLGQIGTTSAAIVATRMKSSFRSIRFSLMVGIGGGVPSERYDIRLGDVVVGMPDHEYGGVVQYDLGKTVEKDGLEGFERTGSLNAPPPVLLNALAMLVARGPLRANQLPRYLSEVKIRISQSKFAYQGEEHDQLFEAEYHHVNGTTCEQCNGKLVVRPPRNSQDPVVHYGTIASGNRVIKNGAVREKFRKKYGMLCFEMEAAGLVNNFPCIVIRGICDYADSHKNDRWQEYAAATAAAYAKDLLSIIPTEQAAKTLTVERFRNKHYRVPHDVSSTFTGRDNICQLLRERCLPSRMQDGPKRFVLYGLGGSGKTQVCLKFAQDYRENFWGIFWIDASSNETAEQGFLDIARACGLEANSKAAKRWLSNIEDPWLLIIDNADNPSQDVSEYFPAGDRGVILLTTRNPECKIHATVGSSEVGQMGFEEATTLLLKTAAAGDVFHEASRNLARSIAGTLGCLALAIVQAGAVIRQKLCSMEEYCGVYSRRRKQLLSRQSTQAKASYKYTVYTTWEVSVNMIENMSDETAHNAIEILKFFSFMHFDGISEEILMEAQKNMQRWQLSEWTQSHQLRMLRGDDSNNWEPYLLREAVTLLSSFSLVTVGGINSHISMHPLVHLWARDRLVEAEQKRCWRIAVSTLAMSIAWKYQAIDYSFRRFLLPHIGSCLSSHSDELFTTGDGEIERLKIASGFALVYQECGRSQEGMELHEKVLEGIKRILGEKHPDTLTSMNNLASSYGDLGRRQEAMELREKVLEVRKRTLGEEHPDTLRSMNALAISYGDFGQRQEAMELREKVLEAGKRILGEKHPDTLTTMGNLAASYGDLGRVQEAMELGEKVLEARERTLGKEHPDTLVSMNNLAISYGDLGQRQEAMELREKVLEARKRILGKKHPDTLTTMDDLAASYGILGRGQEAMELGEKVLEARERTLGKEHPDTLMSMNNLAISYGDLGRRQEAMELREKVLEARKRILGKKHPDTLTSMSDLAASYGDLGRVQEAIELREKILEAREKILGEKHPDTLWSMNALAASYRDLGRGQKAMELREKVLEARKRTLGEEHPDTLWSMNNLAISYGDFSRGQEAMDLREKALEARKRTLGEEHPDTLWSMNALAASYRDLGRRQEAVDLGEKVLEARKRTLGEEHPDTLWSMNALAASYGDLGRRQEAVDLGEEVLEARKKILGEKHPDTLASMNNLAISYRDLGRRQEAVDLREKVLEAMKGTLGDEHPTTLRAIDSLATRDLSPRQEFAKLGEARDTQHPDVESSPVISPGQAPSVEHLARTPVLGIAPNRPPDTKPKNRWNPTSRVRKRRRQPE